MGSATQRRRDRLFLQPVANTWDLDTLDIVRLPFNELDLETPEVIIVRSGRKMAYWGCVIAADEELVVTTS